jgi:deoxyadenosine/deoxycytidine kinase
MKISIEGGIASGKSTLLNTLQQVTRLPVFLEPIWTWTFLDKFYEDQQRWGFTFNLQVIMSMYKWRNNTYDSLYERSPLSCRHVFTQLQYDNEYLTKDELELFDMALKTFSWDQDAIIYIKTDPNTCFDRMHKRNRECEEKVSLKYLQDLHDKHETMIEWIQNNKKDIKVFIVDGNKNANEVFDCVLKLLQELGVA